MRAQISWTAVFLAAVLVPACSDKGAQTCSNPAQYSPEISAAKFPSSARSDNPFYPLVPGTTSQYRDADGNVTDVTVTSDVKMVQGIACVVVHDVAHSASGVLLEDTWDWFAQDADGNIWYMGE